MDLSFVFNHIGYVICFWAVWKSLDVMWDLFRTDTLINSLLGRDSEVERQIAGKLSYFNKVREKDHKDALKAIKDLATAVAKLSEKLTPEADANLRSTVYGLHERLKVATDGLKFDQELTKEVERLRKKVHDMTKVLDRHPPEAVPVVKPEEDLKEGQMYYDAGLHKLMRYDGQQWREIAPEVPKKPVKKGKKRSLGIKEAEQAVLAKNNPHIPQTLKSMKGGYVSQTTTDTLGEPLKYSPQQALNRIIEQSVQEGLEQAKARYIKARREM